MFEHILCRSLTAIQGNLSQTGDCTRNPGNEIDVRHLFSHEPRQRKATASGDGYRWDRHKGVATRGVARFATALMG